MTTSKTDFLIIGAGIIGLTSAYELAKRGASVTVIDKSTPGSGCSHGNAGLIIPSFAQPLCGPGMLMQSIKWLFDSNSPLYIQPEASLLFVRWLSRFLYSMNQRTATRSINALVELSEYSLAEYQRFTNESGFSFELEQKGFLTVAQTAAGLQATIKQMERVAQHGVIGQLLDANETKALEPAITGEIMGGVYFPNEIHVDPQAVVEAYAAASNSKGVNIITNAEAYDFVTAKGVIHAVNTTRGTYTAKQFIMATGAWSHRVGKKLKLALPILGGKGYGITVKSVSAIPQIPITIVDKKITLQAHATGVRLTGTLELVNQDFSISPNRVAAILQGAQECIDLPKQAEVTEVWRGLRPCTPDGVPIIGFSKYYKNLFINAGHQMWGLQTAAGSARLAADLLTDTEPFMDPRPFRAERL